MTHTSKRIPKAAPKRIHSITLKHILDYDGDTSWLGEYAGAPTSTYSINRSHEADCAVQTYNHKPATDVLNTAADYLDNTEDYRTDVREAIELLEEKTQEIQECDCNSRGCRRREFEYFNPSFNYVNKYGDALPQNTHEDVIKYVAQDYDRMERLQCGQWYFIGIKAEAEYSIGNGYAMVQDLSSGGLWGIESDSGEKHIKEIETEQLDSLRDQLKGIGFSSRAISTAFKNLKREDED